MKFTNLVEPELILVKARADHSRSSPQANRI